MLTGTILHLNKNIEFLKKNETKGDHFDLCFSVSKNSILILLNEFKFCGDWRYNFYDTLRDIDISMLKSYNVEEILTPISLCSKFLYNAEIIYLDYNIFNTHLFLNEITIIK